MLTTDAKTIAIDKRCLISCRWSKGDKQKGGILAKVFILINCNVSYIIRSHSL